MKLPKSTAVDLSGTEAVTNMLLQLANQFPHLNGKRVRFCDVGEADGFALYPVQGSAIISTVEDICGHITEESTYPFDLIYRASPKSEEQRIRIKALLDSMVMWLERQPSNVDGNVYRLSEYPPIDDNRTVKEIKCTSPAHIAAVYDDGIEDWVTSVRLNYINEYN